MIINTIVSCVILPHGITDLTHCNKERIPSLLIIYSFSFILTFLSTFIYKYFHLYIFLLSSIVHFNKDFIYLDFSENESYLLSSTIIVIPLCLCYYNLLLAKIFMLTYMILFHVPLHYKKISLKRIDIIPILILTVMFGLYIPNKLEYIENNHLDSIECISLVSLVLGHTLWNID